MEAALDFYGPDQTLRSFRLPREAFTVGSAADDALRLEGEGVFERHASLSWHPNHATWLLSRLHDSGRLAVNSKEVSPRLFVPLSHLDVLTIGGMECRFQKAPQPPMLDGEVCLTLPLDGRLVTIGRGTGTEGEAGNRNIIRLDLDPDDGWISKEHALVGLKKGKYHIEDRSKFGTQLNGQSFDTRILVPGDRFRIRDYFFEFTGSSLVWVDNAAGATIEARNVSVEVGMRNGGTLTILRNVSLRVRTGEFLGVLGGSGQGKSTLLNVLSALMEPGKEGGVTIDKMPPAEFAATGAGIGYVPQDDIVPHRLTVMQALLFAARLRAVLDREALEALVRGVLLRLRLEKHGSKMISQLSGGQRKRVNIASELLSRPTVLFLDEPTSGLDPGMEEEIMSMLQNLKRTGQTIVCTTHVLYKAYLFDRIAFIHDGRLLFLGKPDEARAHFFDRDETGSHGTRAYGRGNAPLERIYGMFRDDQEGQKEGGHDDEDDQAEEDSPEGRRRENAAVWERRFLESPLAPFAKPEPPPPRSITGEGQAGQRPGAWTHFIILLERQWAILRAERRDWISIIAQPLVIGLLAGAVGLEDPEFRLFACMIAAFWFGCSNAAQEICGELPIFRRERVSGVGLHSYILSKVVFRSVVTLVQSALLLVMQLLVVLPWRFLYPGNPAFSLFPGSRDSDSFGIAVSAFSLVALVSVFLGLSISAHAGSRTRAVIWVPLVLIPQILFSGFVVPLAEMTAPMRIFSGIIPSGAAQSMLDLAWISGRKVPLMVDQSVRPLLWWTEPGKNKKQNIDPKTGEPVSDDRKGPTPDTSAVDLDEFNTAWSNIGYVSSKKGAVTKGEDFQVSDRADLRLEGPTGTQFKGEGRLARPVLVLLFWGISGYSVIWLGLCFSQPQTYAPEWAKRRAGRRRD